MTTLTMSSRPKLFKNCLDVKPPSSLSCREHLRHAKDGAENNLSFSYSRLQMRNFNNSNLAKLPPMVAI